MAKQIETDPNWSVRDESDLKALAHCMVPTRDQDGEPHVAMNKAQLERLRSEYPETYRRLQSATGNKLLG